MYFIRHGTVMIHGDEGGDAILNMLNRGDFFGEIAVLTTVPRIAYATAVTMCDFFELSKSDVDEVWSYSICADPSVDGSTTGHGLVWTAIY